MECDEPLVPLTDAQALRDLKREVLDVYQQMKTLTERTRTGRRNSLTSLDTNSSDEMPLHNVKVRVVLGERTGRWWDYERGVMEGAQFRLTAELVG